MSLATTTDSGWRRRIQAGWHGSAAGLASGCVAGGCCEARVRRGAAERWFARAKGRFTARSRALFRQNCGAANLAPNSSQSISISQLPKLMHRVGWYASMLLNRLTGRCGHFWEAHYYSTPIAPEDHRRALNTLRYIHANPKAASVRKGFYDPYSNYGHYSRLEADGLSDWHPSLLQLAPTLTSKQTMGQRVDCPAQRPCHQSTRQTQTL